MWDRGGRIVPYAGRNLPGRRGRFLRLGWNGDVLGIRRITAFAILLPDHGRRVLWGLGTGDTDSSKVRSDGGDKFRLANKAGAETTKGLRV